MPTMDIFRNDAFSVVEMTAALEKIPYVPQLLGSLNVFEPRRIRTELVVIEKREGVLTLIPTTPRGAPPVENVRTGRDVRAFPTVRLAKGDTITAAEIQGIRAFGTESELLQVQQEVAQRMAQIRVDLELTLENHRLGAIQGIVLDADGITEIRNWYTEWGIAQAAEIDFELDDANTDIRAKCTAVVRAMQVAAKGAWLPSTQVYALCSDTFYDALVGHANIRATYLNQAAASELRQAVSDRFVFGGITFINYRGLDDGTSVSVATDKARFFPVGAPGVFLRAQSPAENFDYVNTPGLDVYAMTIPDRDRNAWVRIEEYSYPLFVCTRPEMLQRAKRA